MLLIRPATDGDAHGIRQVHVAAFPTAMEADLVEALVAAGRADIPLVAEADGRIVGHVLFSPVTLQANCAATGGVGLAPVAVLPDQQRRGIGSWLVLEGIAVCRRRGHRFVVVLGEPAWYRRFGFEPAHRYGLASEYDAGMPSWCCRCRRAYCRPKGAGEVRTGIRGTRSSLTGRSKPSGLNHRPGGSVPDLT